MTFHVLQFGSSLLAHAPCSTSFRFGGIFFLALFGDLLRPDLTPLVQDLCRFTLTEDHWQLDLRSFCIGVVVGFMMELKERQGAGHTLILALKNAFNPP